MNNNTQDRFPEGSLIGRFLGLLHRQAAVEVFSDSHILLSRAVLSNSFPGKSVGFLGIWLLADFRRCLRPARHVHLSRLVVANCRRINHLLEKHYLAGPSASDAGWLGSPTKRRGIKETYSQVKALDVCRDLAVAPSEWMAMCRETLRLRRALKTTFQTTLEPEAKQLIERLSGFDLLMHCNLMVRAERLHARCGAPDLLLGSDSEIFGMAMARAAHRTGSKVGCLQHGTLNEHNLYGTCDHMLVWSTSIEDYIEARLDQGHRQPALKTEVFGSIHSIQPQPVASKPPQRILFLDQDTPFGRRMWSRRWIDKLNDWLAKLPEQAGNLEFHYRDHPSKKEACLPAGWLSSPQTNLEAALKEADIIITMNSTAGIEAGASGQAVIFLTGADLVWLGSMQNLTPCFVLTPEELLDRITQLTDSSTDYEQYRKTCAKLCSDYLGTRTPPQEGNTKTAI